MSYAASFVNYFLHADVYLNTFAATYGAWIYALLFAIIFCETGLVVTAILPGDSLLFAAGAIAATTGAFNIYLLLLLLIIAACLGNISNYFIGYYFGHFLFRDKNSRIFKQAYLNKTHDFYQKYGSKTIVIARFMPIIRTFAPFVAGMAEMRLKIFMLYTLFGAFLWVISLLLVSYYFGNIPLIKNNFSLVILAIIILSILPPILEYIKHRILRSTSHENT